MVEPGEVRAVVCVLGSKERGLFHVSRCLRVVKELSKRKTQTTAQEITADPWKISEVFY